MATCRDISAARRLTGHVQTTCLVSRFIGICRRPAIGSDDSESGWLRPRAFPKRYAQRLEETALVDLLVFGQSLVNAL